MGQWKNSTISNPEWNKRALSWPVYEDGTWNSVRQLKILGVTVSEIAL